MVVYGILGDTFFKKIEFIMSLFVTNLLLTKPNLLYKKSRILLNVRNNVISHLVYNSWNKYSSENLDNIKLTSYKS